MTSSILMEQTMVPMPSVLGMLSRHSLPSERVIVQGAVSMPYGRSLLGKSLHAMVHRSNAERKPCNTVSGLCRPAGRLAL